MHFDCVFIFARECAQVRQEETLRYPCVESAVVMSGRWFALSGRLALKGCLGSHRVSRLMRGEGRDGPAPRRETDAVKTMRVP